MGDSAIAKEARCSKCGGMKKVCMFCLSLITCITLFSAEESNERELRQPTWIERLFGAEAEEPEQKAEEDEKVVEKSEDAKTSKKVAAGKFTEEERAVLENWQKGKASWKQTKRPLPPGLRKKLARGGELPPGWKKKLEPGTVLDPEVDAAAETLPDEILKRLPQTEETAEIVRVGTQIIKVIKGSREIIDIIDGEVPREGSDD